VRPGRSPQSRRRRHEIVTMMRRLAGVLALFVAIVTCTASCASKTDQPPQMNLANMQMTPAPPGSCQIDAIKMCRDEGGTATPPAEQAATMPMPTYGPPNLPDSIEFQIPAGQTIKLMCYYDPQHASVYRADATPDSALTTNSVEYMKKRGFCVSK
jgi:hypothetical protein